MNSKGFSRTARSRRFLPARWGIRRFSSILPHATFHASRPSWTRRRALYVERAIATIGEAEWATRAEAMSALRKARRTVRPVARLADLARAAPLDTITHCLSDFADAACSAALRFALADAARQGKWQGGTAEASGFSLLAMGKQGARELDCSGRHRPDRAFRPGAGDRRGRRGSDDASG